MGHGKVALFRLTDAGFPWGGERVDMHTPIVANHRAGACCAESGVENAFKVPVLARGRMRSHSSSLPDENGSLFAPTTRNAFFQGKNQC